MRGYQRRWNYRCGEKGKGLNADVALMTAVSDGGGESGIDSGHPGPRPFGARCARQIRLSCRISEPSGLIVRGFESQRLLEQCRRFGSTRRLNANSGGESGIRTHETPCEVYWNSSPAPSTARPSLRINPLRVLSRVRLMWGRDSHSPARGRSGPPAKGRRMIVHGAAPRTSLTLAGGRAWQP